MSEEKIVKVTSSLPPQTIEVAAKSMYKQASEYGFQREDIVRFVNVLLDLAYGKRNLYTPPPTQRPVRKSGKKKKEKAAANNVSIRQYREEDLPLLEKWTDDPEGRYFLLTRTRYGEPETLQEMLGSDRSELGIVQDGDKPIGVFAYLNLDREQRKAELRKLIGDPEARGKGYASVAARLWIEHGIKDLGLHKIYLHTMENQLANIRVNEQLGFRVEGLLRDECLIDGEYCDVLRMSLIAPS